MTGAPKTSRRELMLGVAAATTFVVSGAGRALAATTTRYDITTPRGQTMVALYEKAVRAMQDPAINYPPQPQSWTFQAYIHGVPSNPFDPALSGGLMPGSKELAVRVDQIYGNPAAGTPQAAWKKAALACWATCTHGSPFFTTWHRWYMFYFEQICRAMCGDPSFTLPYWNYGSNPTTAQQLPAPFRDTNLRLYFDDRGVGFSNPQASGTQTVAMNNGGFMPFSQSDYRLALTTPAMFPSDGVPAFPPSGLYYSFGLSGRLECMPHDLVHNNVGGWMGNVPSAAGDPIFYMHHCQIDRLFASWQQLPGSTFNFGTSSTQPDRNTWLQTRAYFVDATGQLVNVKLGDCLDPTILGYAYDSYAAPSKATPPLVAMATTTVAATDAPKVATLRIGTFQAKAGGSTITLAPEAAIAASAEEKPTPSTLVLDGIHMDRRPPAPLSVFVNLPKDTAPDMTGPYWVGTLGFFRFDAATGVPMKHAADDPHAAHAEKPSARFDVREILDHQRARGLWDGGPITVTITTLGADKPGDAVYVTFDGAALLP